MLLAEPLQLSYEFETILQYLEEGRSAFITGKAGTGKSTLLRIFRQTTKKKVVVLAPTGVAALNVQGQTIHSFFGFPPRIIQENEIYRRPNHQLYKRIETLVIDEISMVRADVLYAIDLFLKVNRASSLPFGGVQVVFFGDLYQLPPVVSSNEERIFLDKKFGTPYFFSVPVLAQVSEFQVFELQKVYRQKEAHFLKLLEAIRTQRIDEEEFNELNKRFIPDFHNEDFYITLCSRNDTAYKINGLHLDKINTKTFCSTAEVFGAFNPQLYPVDYELKLKEGAQIMTTRNDTAKNYVNGTIGKLIKIEQDKLLMGVEEAGELKTVEVLKSTWEIIKYKADEEDPSKIVTEIIGSYTQFPVKLAWAITIHKSQGQTFDKVIIDLGTGAFEFGQTYVALSRCRTLNGIILKRKLQPRDILVDERVVDFMNQYR